MSGRVSGPYHDEDIRAVQTLRPWLIAAAILIVVAYTGPFLELARSKSPGARPYSPDSPVAIR